MKGRIPSGGDHRPISQPEYLPRLLMSNGWSHDGDTRQQQGEVPGLAGTKAGPVGGIKAHRSQAESTSTWSSTEAPRWQGSIPAAGHRRPHRWAAKRSGAHGTAGPEWSSWPTPDSYYDEPRIVGRAETHVPTASCGEKLASADRGTKGRLPAADLSPSRCRNRPTELFFETKLIGAGTGSQGFG